MNVINRTGFAALCAAAALVAAAPLASAGNAGVNIIYPPKLASDFEKTEETDAASSTTIVVRFKQRSNYRNFWRTRHKFRVNRALFQNYLSDRSKYGGRRYPF